MSLEFCHESWRVGSEFDANNMNPWIKPTLCQLFRLVVVWDLFLASFWAFNNTHSLSQITWALLLTITMITVYPSFGVWWDHRFMLWMENQKNCTNCVSMDQNLWEMFAVPCWFYGAKNYGSFEIRNWPNSLLARCATRPFTDNLLPFSKAKKKRWMNWYMCELKG